MSDTNENSNEAFLANWEHVRKVQSKKQFFVIDHKHQFIFKYT